MFDSHPVAETSWPKLAHGSIDWETVFEDPDNGLLARIARADTPGALRETALAIIRQLFARKGDEIETARLSGELTELIADDMPPQYLATVAEAVTRTFREMKELRTKKALEFEQAEAIKGALAATVERTKTVAPERRKASAAQQSIKQALDRSRKRKAVRRAIVAIGAAVGVAIGAYLYLRTPALPARADQILLQQMKSAATGSVGKTHVYGGSLKARRYLGDISVTAENVPVNACVTLGLYLGNQGTFSINGEMLAYATPNQARTLCEQASAPIRTTWVPGQ